MSNREDLLRQAKAKREEAARTREIALMLSVDEHRQIFERQAQAMDREADRLRDKAARSNDVYTTSVSLLAT